VPQDLMTDLHYNENKLVHFTGWGKPGTFKKTNTYGENFHEYWNELYK
jgi:hypothetical protein